MEGEFELPPIPKTLAEVRAQLQWLHRLQLLIDIRIDALEVLLPNP